MIQDRIKTLLSQSVRCIDDEIALKDSQAKIEIFPFSTHIMLRVKIHSPEGEMGEVLSFLNDIIPIEQWENFLWVNKITSDYAYVLNDARIRIFPDRINIEAEMLNLPPKTWDEIACFAYKTNIPYLVFRSDGMSINHLSQSELSEVQSLIQRFASILQIEPGYVVVEYENNFYPVGDLIFHSDNGCWVEIYQKHIDILPYNLERIFTSEGEIIGYKILRWDKTLNRFQSPYIKTTWSKNGKLRSNQPIEIESGKGIFAYSHPASLLSEESFYWKENLCFAAVAGYGKVAVHEQGWRAQYCRILAHVKISNHKDMDEIEAAYLKIHEMIEKMNP